ncbi:MAG: ATP-binding protein [Candidatus Coatesbacteria bacterium]|nr:ATP-binding protein [Candidatus Coatesbacteria bacterium]
MRIQLADIRNNHQGFSFLSWLANQLEHCFLDVIEIDMSQVTWFDANMCSPFGAILYRASRSLNSVSIDDIRPDVQKILCKNEFLASYGRPISPDTYGTVIPYKRFERQEDRYSASYIETHLRGKGMPEMTKGLRKKLLESILEIFSNAVNHSRTELGIFSCGQYFPKRERLDFSISDLGIGIRENIKRVQGVDLSASNAIDWAISKRNTTKTGDIPGGSGLKILREFISMNQGRMQIVSDSGYWELGTEGAELEEMGHPFPGTVVNLEFNTADTNSYCLASEITPRDIL